MTDERAATLYEEEVGEIRNLPDGHPDAWMWSYKGTSLERERLLDFFQAEAEAECEQMSLLDG
jgi:hypothetical protein